jgi:hypothetical protein
LTKTDEGTRLAWVTYRDSLRDVDPAEYEDAERRSWDQLQRTLERLERQPMEVARSRSHKEGGA